MRRWLVLMGCGVLMSSGALYAQSIAINSVTPDPLIVPPGASGSVTVTTSRSGFTGSITLNATGQPSGTTVSYSQPGTSNNGTITFNVSGSAPTGSYAVQVSASGSGVATAIRTFTLSVQASGVTITGITPPSVTLAPGNSQQVTVTIMRQGGVSGSVSLQVLGPLPPGVSATNGNISGGQNSGSININAGPGASPTTVTLTVQASASSGMPGTATFTLTVTPPPGIALESVTPPSVSLTPGGPSQTVTVTIQRVSGYSNSVNLQITSEPPGVSASIQTNIGPGTAGTITISALPSGAGTSGTIAFEAFGSGGASATGTIAYTVSSPSISISSISPASVTLTQGGSASIGVSIVRNGGYAGSVSLSIAPLPAGVSATFAHPGTGNSGSIMLSATATAATGTITATVAASGASVTTATASLGVTVQAGEGIGIAAVNPPSVTLTAGGAAQIITITLSRSGGFSGSVSLDVTTPPPTGVTFSQTPFGTGNSGSITVSAAAGAPTSTTTVSFQASSPSVASANGSFVLTIQPPPAISISSVSPPGITLTPGGTTQSITVTIARSGGYTGFVSLQLPPLPNGVSASITEPGTGNTGTIALFANNMATSISTSVTFEARGAGVSPATSRFDLIVQAPITLVSVSPPSVSLRPGGTAQTVTLTISRAPGYTSNVNVNLLTTLPGSITTTSTGTGSGSVATITLRASSSAPDLSTTVVFELNGPGGAEANGTFSLTVSEEPSIAIASVTPATLGVSPGGAPQTVTVMLTRNGGYSSPVSLAVTTPLPTGVSVSSLASFDSGTVGSISLLAAPGAPSSTTTITFEATGSGVTKAMGSFVLVVQGQTAGIAIGSVSPASLTLTPGGPTQAVSISIVRSGGYTGLVSLVLVSTLPPGVVPTVTDPGSGNTGTIALFANNTAAAGSVTVTFEARGSGVTAAGSNFGLTVGPPGVAISIASVSPSTISLTPGGPPQTVLVTISRSPGYTSNVDLNVTTALPAGIATNATSTGSGSTANTATITVQAGSSVQNTTMNVAFRARGGGGAEATGSFTLIVSTPQSIAIGSITPVPVSLTPGGTPQTATVTLIRNGGYGGFVGLSVTNPPPVGVTITGTTPFGTNNSGSITFQAAADAPSTSVSLGLQASGPGVDPANGSLSLVVAQGQTPAIAIASVSPQVVTLPRGGANQIVSITISRSGGYTGSVQLDVVNAPTFLTTSRTNPGPGNEGTISIGRNNSAPAGTYPLTFRLSGAGVTAVTGTITVVVEDGSTSSIAISSLTPDPLVLTTGSAGTVNVLITRTNFTGGISLAIVSPLPSGVTPSFAQVGTGSSGSVTFNASSAAPVGSTTVQLRASGTGVDPVTRAFTLTIERPAAFSISGVSPAAVTLSPGSTQTLAVTIARGTGFTSTVTLQTTTPLPAGVTAFTSGPGTGNSGTIVLTASSSAAIVSGMVIAFVATSAGGISDTASFSLTVQPPTGIAITSVAPAVITLIPGASPQTVSVSIQRLGGYAGDVSLAVGALPPGVSATPNGPANGTLGTIVIVAATNSQISPTTVSVTASGSGVAPANGSFRIEAGAADLVAGSLTVTPLTPTDLTDITVSGSLSNIGAAIMTSFTWELRVDGRVVANDRPASLGANAQIGPAAVTWTGRLTSGSHTVDLVVDANSEIAESNEANNSASRTIVVTAAVQCPGPFAHVAPQSGARLPTGTTTTPLAWQESALATSYEVYFGTSATPPLFANTTATTVTVPVRDGVTYFWRVTARNACGATNSSSGISSFVGGPEPKPDLSAVVNSIAPPRIVAGESITLAFNVVNQGAATSPASGVGLWLSNDVRLDASDVSLGREPVAPIGPKSVASGTSTRAIASAVQPGTYFVIAVADDENEIAEADESNNTGYNTVTIDARREPARVVVAAFPAGMVQTAGAAGASDSFTLTNAGQTVTALTLTQAGDFYLQTPTAFSLAPGQSQLVSLAGLARPAGSFDGVSTVSGDGTGSGLQISVRLFSARPPASPPQIVPVADRVEIVAPADENPSANVAFQNIGGSDFEGIAVSDVPWLVPSRDVLRIGPGQTQNVRVDIIRGNRPDAEALNGGVSGILSLRFLQSGGASLRRTTTATTGGSSVNVTVIDVVRAAPAAQNLPALASGEVATFLPAVFAGDGRITDLLLAHRASTGPRDARLFFTSAGATQLLTAPLAVNTTVSFPSLGRSTFPSSSSGNLQVRGGAGADIAVLALQSVSTAAGNRVVPLPPVRSDLGIVSGERIVLSGVERTADVQTATYVQEVAGVEGSVRIEFVDAQGQAVGPAVTRAIPVFGSAAITNEMPIGATTVRVVNTSPGAAKFSSYAVVTDGGGSAFVVTDVLRAARPAADSHIIPLVGSRAGVARELYVTNVGSTPAEVRLEFAGGAAAARRRAVSPAGGNAAIPALDAALAPPVTLQPDQTVAIPIEVTSSTYARLSSRGGAITASGRVIASAEFATVTTAIAAAPVTKAIGYGEQKRLLGIDDASRATVSAGSPNTFRTSVALVETAGAPATVRVGLNFTLAASGKVSSVVTASKIFSVGANQMVLIEDLGRAIVGEQRDTLPDLRNMQLDVEVVAGSGRVLPFVQSTENATGAVVTRSD